MNWKRSGKMPVKTQNSLWIKPKSWHNKHITRREIKEGDLFFLFNLRLKLFLGKLRSRWSRPFKVTQVFTHRAVEVWSETLGTFKVNGQRLKPYFSRKPIEKGYTQSFINPLAQP